MPYYRVYYDKYCEAVYVDEAEARKDYMTFIDDELLEEDLTVELFNEETQKWE